jgi:hypothetical protein
VIWATNTKGTGTDNRLVMRNNGNLSIYTSADKIVWSGGSGPGMLIAGQTLGKGGRLSARLYHSAASPITTLVMQAKGDLVLSYGKKAIWSTHTSVAGSSAELDKNGDFVVYSPTHKALWTSHTSKIGSTAVVYVIPCGAFIDYRTSKAHTVPWSTPYVSEPGCL